MKKIVFTGMSILLTLSVLAQRALTLEDCRQMALTHNKTLQMAKESVKAASELKEAAYAQFLPNFSANASYLWNQKGISLMAEDAHLPVQTWKADGTFDIAGSVNNKWTKVGETYVPLDANNQPFDPSKNPEKLQWKNTALLPKEALELDMRNVFVGSIGFIQPIYMGGKIRELYKIAKSSERLAHAQAEDKTEELLLEVDEAYWRVVSVENKYKLAKEYRALLAKVDSNVQVMIEEGVATKAESLKVKVKLNEADVALTRAENGLHLSKMALSQLCGMELEADLKLADVDLNTVTSPTPLIPLQQAIANRPEIKSLSELEKIAESNEKIMFSRLLPTVVLSGNYMVSNPNSFDGFEKKFGGMFSFGVVANIPLYHFGDKFHTLRAAKIQRKIAGLKIDEAKEKIQLQIKQSAYRVNESEKKRSATQNNIKQAEENLRYASEGFDAGVITSTDLLAAQTAWLSAKSENIDATIDVRLCNVYLAKSMGILK